MAFGRLASLAFSLSLMTAAAHAEGETAVIVEADAAELAGNIAKGEKLYRRNCRACHGATAAGASSYPRLVGHPAEFLIDRVVRYRAGERFGPNTPLMAQRVRDLSDQDIADVAAFILSLEDD